MLLSTVAAPSAPPPSARGPLCPTSVQHLFGDVLMTQDEQLTLSTPKPAAGRPDLGSLRCSHVFSQPLAGFWRKLEGFGPTG